MSEIEILESLKPVEIYTAGLDNLLARIATEARSFIADVNTEEGRDDIRTRAFKLAKTKTFFDKVGKDMGEELRTNLKKINEQRSKAVDFMEALQAEIRKPLTDYEAVEKKRVADHEAALLRIQELKAPGLTKEAIEEQLAELHELRNRGWQEFAERASDGIVATEQLLVAALGAQIKLENERVELEALRAEKAKRDAEEAARKAEAEKAAELIRIKEEAAKAAEDAIRQAKEAAQKAEADKKAAEEKAEADKKAALAKAEADKEAAIQAERARVEAKEKTEREETERREKDRSHRAKINGEALKALLENEIDPDTSKKVLTLIAKGKIPNVKILY